MTCDECRKMIYGHPELDEREKQRAAEHMNTCTSCADLLTQFQREQMDVRSTLSNTPEQLSNTNPFLTARIIAAIQQERSDSVLARFLPFVRISSIRYSMATVSLALLVFFLVEFNPGENVSGAVDLYKRLPVAKTIRLNSIAFRERIRNSVKSNQTGITASFSLSECLKICRENSNQANCEDCKTLFNQLKNEGI
jgi:hypothetical protein